MCSNYLFITCNWKHNEDGPLKELYGLTPYISRDALFTYTHVHALRSSKSLTDVISQISSVRSGICL